MCFTPDSVLPLEMHHSYPGIHNINTPNNSDSTLSRGVGTNMFMDQIFLTYFLLAMIHCMDCCDHEAYQCRDILPQGIVKCGSKNNSMSVLNGYCTTIDKDTLEAGQYDGMYNDLPGNISLHELDDFMGNMQVQLHRAGTLCGKCQDGY